MYKLLLIENKLVIETDRKIDSHLKGLLLSPVFKGNMDIMVGNFSFIKKTIRACCTNL